MSVSASGARAVALMPEPGNLGQGAAVSAVSVAGDEYRHLGRSSAVGWNKL